MADMYSARITVTISHGLDKLLRQRARLEGRTVSDVVREALKVFLSENKLGRGD